MNNTQPDLSLNNDSLSSSFKANAQESKNNNENGLNLNDFIAKKENEKDDTRSNKEEKQTQVLFCDC